MGNKVSIIIPCCAAERYIGDILGDIRRQTYSDWELIVVGNGGNQEQQREIVNKVIGEDSRIRYFSLDPSGVSRARNFGIEQASGEWIAFVDADDRVPEDWLARFEIGFDSQVDLIAGGITYRYMAAGKSNVENLKLEMEFLAANEHEEMLRIYASNLAVMYSPCSKVFRRALLLNNQIRFDERLSVYEDGVFCLNAVLKCKAIGFVRQTGYLYCRRPGSAIERYHEDMELALTIRRELLHRFALMQGLLPHKIELTDNYNHLADALDILLNSLRLGTPYGFGNQVALAKRLWANAEIKRRLHKSLDIGKNLPLRLFCFFARMNAPFLCVMVFRVLLATRKIVGRLR